MSVLLKDAQACNSRAWKVRLEYAEAEETKGIIREAFRLFGPREKVVVGLTGLSLATIQRYKKEK